MNENKSKQIKEILEDPEAVKELKQLVLARLQVMPDTLNVAIGSEQFSKNKLINHVNKQDEVGEQIMGMELEFLQDLASGAVYEQDFSDNLSYSQ